MVEKSIGDKVPFTFLLELVWIIQIMIKYSRELQLYWLLTFCLLNIITKLNWNGNYD